VFFIYLKVLAKSDFTTVCQNLLQTLQKEENLWPFLLVIILMFCNWMLEAAKWQLLLKHIHPVSLLHAFRSVMSGVTVSFFTPNRVGEFAGRIMHLNSNVRITASIASVIGSMNQLLITIIAGGIGLLASLNNYGFTEPVLTALIYLAVITALFSACVIYFRIRFINRLFSKVKMMEKAQLYTRVFENYKFRQLLAITFLSALRYLVFTSQFVFVLWLFNVDVEYLQSIRVISLIYVVMSVVPTIAIAELTLRGSVALYFFSSLTADSASVLAASSLLWIINLAIPAIIGGLSVFYFRLNR
jgi:uncharacterized membrane protein YbhN (UPF0104 family)